MFFIKIVFFLALIGITFLIVKFFVKFDNNSLKFSKIPHIRKFQAQQQVWIKPPIYFKPIHGKKPYKKEELPIPEKEVESVIDIELPKNRDIKKFQLVLNKEGKVWKTINIPNDIKITQTHIEKYPLPKFCLKFGLGIAPVVDYDPTWQKNKIKFPPIFTLSFIQYKKLYASTGLLWMTKYELIQYYYEYYYKTKNKFAWTIGIEWMPIQLASEVTKKIWLEIGVGFWYSILKDKDLPKILFSLGVKF